MHSKVYLLENAGQTHVLVGSSNLTLGGLQTNIESNLAASFPSSHRMVQQWRENFEAIWSLSHKLVLRTWTQRCSSFGRGVSL